MSRVLAIDDHEQNVVLLKKLLEKSGIVNVTIAYSAEEGIEMLKKNK